MARIPEGREDHRNNRNAIVDRRSFESQLFDAQGRPTPVMYAFCARMEKEAGNLDREGRIAWAETVFNRCSSRRHGIDYELRNHGDYNYWPAHQSDPGSLRNQAYVDIIREVLRNGTNLTCGATGNASLSVGVGRETYRNRGERFGVETPDARWWREQFGGLIRGVGRFVGDIAGAIGDAAVAVVTGVASAGLWVLNGIASAIDPQRQHTPDRSLATPERFPPRYTRPQQQHADRPVELRERQPQQSLGLWRLNGVGRSDDVASLDRPESHPTRRPSP